MLEKVVVSEPYPRAGLLPPASSVPPSPVVTLPTFSFPLLAPTAAGVGHVGKGHLLETRELLFPHAAQPLLLPAPQPEQGTGTAQGVSRQDSGGCGGYQESQGRGRCGA